MVKRLVIKSLIRINLNVESSIVDDKPSVFPQEINNEISVLEQWNSICFSRNHRPYIIYRLITLDRTALTSCGPQAVKEASC